MTPKQYEKFRAAHLEHEKSRFKQADVLNHILGRYIAYSFNDPSKYPEMPFLSGGASDDLPEMTDEEMERQARRNTIRLGGEIKRHDN